MRQLGLDDWVRSSRGRARRVGPYARRALPATACCGRSTPTSTPDARGGRGGTLLTGVGGDELWGSSRRPVRLRRRALRSRRSPRPPRGPRAQPSRSTSRGSRAGRRAGAARRSPARPPPRPGRSAGGWPTRAACATSRSLTAALGAARRRRGRAVVNPLLDLDCGPPWPRPPRAAGSRPATRALARSPGSCSRPSSSRGGPRRASTRSSSTSTPAPWRATGTAAGSTRPRRRDALRAHWLGEPTPDRALADAPAGAVAAVSRDRVEEPVGRLGQ